MRILKNHDLLFISAGANLVLTFHLDDSNITASCLKSLLQSKDALNNSMPGCTLTEKRYLSHIDETFPVKWELTN